MKPIPSKDQIIQAIRISAAQYGLDPEIMIRQCKQESGFVPGIKNPRSGALGLFQFMPATAKEWKVKPLEWKSAVDGGCKYMRYLLKRYNGEYDKALAAYNWGLGNLDKAIARRGHEWADALPGETENYLARILPSPDGPVNA